MRKVYIDAHTFKPLTQEQISEWDTWVTYGKVLTPTQTANLSEHQGQRHRARQGRPDLQPHRRDAILHGR